MTLFIVYVWIGGISGIWGKVSAADAIFWPALFGRYLASITAEHLVGKEDDKECE